MEGMKIRRIYGKIAIFFVMYLITNYQVLAEKGWTLSIGTSYRDFDDVNFGSLKFRNFDNVDSSGGPFGIQDLASMQPNFPDGSQLSVETVEFTGSDGDVDFSESLAPIVVGVERYIDIGSIVDVEDSFYLGLMFDFLFFNPKVSETVVGNSTNVGNFNVTQSTYTVVGGRVVGPPISSVSENQFASGTNVKVKNNFDMNLFVFDFGLKPAFRTEQLSVGGAIGFSVNIADIEMRQSEEGDFTLLPNAVNSSAGPVTGPYRITRSDDTLDVFSGGYLAFDMEFNITESFGLGLQYRYDWVIDGDAGTNQAELDLDGQSGTIRFLYHF